MRISLRYYLIFSTYLPINSDILTSVLLVILRWILPIRYWFVDCLQPPH